MKYFWYYLRNTYRNNKYMEGHYDASNGTQPESKNSDYSRGYLVATNRVEREAKELKTCRDRLRKAEAHVVSMHARSEAVKRVVAENL